MGYEADGSLEEMFSNERSLERAERRIVSRVGNFLLERTESHTPIAKIPPGVPVGVWLKARGGRPPRHLRDSWRAGPVELDERGYKIDVYTEDEVAPFVEYPTAPHLIVPRNPEGWLRWWDKFGDIHFARLVHHPGTEGSYMLHKALAETEVEWQVIAREEAELWARTYWRSS